MQLGSLFSLGNIPSFPFSSNIQKSTCCLLEEKQQETVEDQFIRTTSTTNN